MLDDVRHVMYILSDTMPKELDPLEETVVHILSDGSGWIHTHGLDKHGLPELEVRDVPMFLAVDAVMLLNAISSYMLNNTDKKVLAGQNMQVGDRHVAFENGIPVNAKVDADHYKTRRLRVVDAPYMLGSCESPSHQKDAS
jgi:hypothetical protein